MKTNQSEHLPQEAKLTIRSKPNYSALKTVRFLISLLGYMILLAGVCGLLFFATNQKTLHGFLILFTSVVIALPLLVFSQLFYDYIEECENGVFKI